MGRFLALSMVTLVACAPMPGPVRYRTVSPGPFYACAIRTDDTLWCWGGSTDSTQINFRAHPGQIGADSDWSDVSVGWNGTCALKKNGSVWRWQSGDLSEGLYPLPWDVVPYEAPPVAALPPNLQAFVPGVGSSVCLFDQASQVWCEGDNFDGELGDGTTDRPTTLEEVPGGPWRVATAGGTSGSEEFGGAHMCAIAGTSLSCWGSNLFGTLGVPAGFESETSGVFSPARVGGEWQQVSTTDTSTCGVRADGTLWYWGHDYNLNSERSDWRPTQLSTDTDWAAVSAGDTGTCGLKRDGTAWCWGLLTAGQVGAAFSETPQLVNDPHHWTMLRFGLDSVCAIATDQTIWCWGGNSYFELGDGAQTDSLDPVPLVEPPP